MIQVSDYVVFNLPGGWASCNPFCNKVDANTTRFTLTRLTEGRLSGCQCHPNHTPPLPSLLRREKNVALIPLIPACSPDTRRAVAR